MLNRLARTVRRKFGLARQPATAKTLPSRQAYALWSASYPPQAHNPLMELEQATMLALLPDMHGKQVLDLACGTGRYGLIAFNKGATSVIGFDDSLDMLRRSELHPVAQAGMIQLPLAACSVDVILCGMALGHLPSEAMHTAIAEIGRVLRPSGQLLFSDFHPMVYLRGGRRTFTASTGVTYEVEHYPHLISNYYETLVSAGFSVIAIREPLGNVNGESFPAVLVMRCTK